MKPAVLFLQGIYRDSDARFYRRLCRGRYKVAVDGGLRFFIRAGLRPDLLIGDFDSVGKHLRLVPRQTEVLEFPPEKDWTDTELAVECCLERGYRQIDIVQPSLGEPDHFLANVGLLTGARSRRTELRIVSPDYELRWVENQRLRLFNAKGALVSVLPASDSIRLSTKGTLYDIVRVVVRRGSTLATRNRVSGSRAEIAVRGRALLYVKHPRGRRRVR